MEAKTKTPRALALVAVLAAAGLALAGCANTSSGSGSSGSTTSVALGVEPWIGYGPWHVAEKKGYFTDNGVKAKITNFDTDSDINAALASGKLQAASVASHTALKFVESGVDVSIVLVLDASETADAILSGPGVSSIADLKGKQVAYEEGTTSDLLLNYALAQNGMSLSDINRVPMDADAAGTALIAGKVPVAVTYEPYITEAKQKDPQIKALYTASEKEGLISDVLVVRNDFLKSNPKAVVGLAKTWGQAVDYYKSDTNDAQSIIAKAVGSSAADLKTAFEGVKFFSLADNKEELTGTFKTSTLPSINKAAISAKLLTKTTDPSKVIDASFVEKAAK
jgi:NitT/TauT family transport system substrate-binding protein